MQAKKIPVLTVTLGLLAIASVFLIVFYSQYRHEKSTVDLQAVSVDQTKEFKSANGVNLETAQPEQASPVAELPKSYLLKVDFQSQAPYGDWSEPYENACEEASIITVKHYLNNQDLSKEQMKSEIDGAVDWQFKNWQAHKDLDAQMSLFLAKQHFGLEGKIISGLQAENIKKYIASGLPVIAPTAGRKLGNPNFRGAGPEYHMLVIIGYDDSQGIFITNDPGTRKGESYVYKYQTLLDAISGPGEDMSKDLIVLSK
jgi:hypothetical protein